MKYKFDTERGVFTLYDPETGKDWSNHFFNEKSWVMSVTHFGATYSRYIDEKSVQVTLNCPLSSFVYLRDAQSKRYWNVGGYPSLQKIRNYSCEHGQNYTKISSEFQKIRASVTYAVAPDDTREVWQICVSNLSERERSIDIFSVTAFDLNGYAQPVYYSAVTTSATEFVREANAVFNENLNPYRPHELSSGYILSSEPVFAYEGNYEKFIGTMGTQTKPVLLEKGADCGNSTATVRQRGGILQNRVCLAPGESKTVYYVLGLIRSRKELVSRAQELVQTCPEIIRTAVRSENRFGNLRTKCPEKQFEQIFNFWAEKQVSFCMLGKKAVRDNAQLGMAMLNFNVRLAKKTLDECIAHQYADGHAVLTWYPYLERNIYSDPSAWLIFAVCAYVKETGDLRFLHDRVPYMDEGEDSVYGHLQRAVEWFGLPENQGPHGLPRIFHADWNDALNIPDEHAESVLMAMLIGKVYGDMAQLSEAMGNAGYARELNAKKEALSALVNKVAFNGEYYVRAFSKFGIVGDKNCKNGGEIYVNPQSWSVLSGMCPPDVRKTILEAIDKTETEDGIPLCSPPYARYDESVGRMSGMLPGVYENGGIYNHAGCFKVMADCMAGRGDRAVCTLKKIIPGGEGKDCYATTAEPYVFTNCYLKHPSVDKMVGFSWQTGTSAWGLMAYYEGILGLQPEYDGLHVRPCFPKGWKKAEAYRNFRGNKLHILYRNKGGNTVRLKADGVPVEGDKIPAFADELEHTISVVLE